MAKFNGTVILSGMISPTDTTDAYPTHEDILGKGGYSSVDTLELRDNISTLRRKQGMMVYVVSEEKTYQLKTGLENSDWSEFTTGNSGDATTEELKITDISVNGIVNSIFVGIEIPDGEILYVRGNDIEIEPVVYNGVLETVLENNKYNNFIIKYDGTSSTVYVNSLVNETHIQTVVNNYPLGYDLIDLSSNNISDKISNILSETFTDTLQVYAFEGVMSTLEKELNPFIALNKNKEFVVMYDGSNYTAYKKEKVSIDDLKNRMVLN